MHRHIQPRMPGSSAPLIAVTLTAAAFAACSPAPDSRSVRAPQPERSSALQSQPEAGVGASVAAADIAEQARAVLRPTDGSMTSGVVEFTANEAGTLTIRIEVAGLAPGLHGFHVHEFGDCSAPDASSAGDHFAPAGHPHAGPTDAVHHLGDLGNIEAGQDGIAVTEIENDELSLTGASGIAERAVIVHSGRDDYQTQPSGNSGDPAACGRIDLVEYELRAGIGRF